MNSNYPNFNGLRKYNELVKVVEEINKRNLKIFNKKTQYFVMDIEPIYSTCYINGVEEKMFHEELVAVTYSNHESTKYVGQIFIKNLYRFWLVVDQDDLVF